MIAQVFLHRAREDEVGVPPVPAADHAHAVDFVLLLAAVPCGREHRGPVAARHHALQDLVQVDLRAAGFGILDVAPVEGDEMHPARGHYFFLPMTPITIEVAMRTGCGMALRTLSRMRCTA